MGQYYKAIFINENQKPIASVSSYDFGSGAKLMEHSWLKNSFVRFVEKQLMVTPQRIVWGGDYADNEEQGINLYSLSETMGKLTSNEEVKNKYEHDFKEIAPLTAKYLINHDKKQFVNKTKTPKDAEGWQVHPLPLLTCEGNGRGGGDFRGESDLIGIWARNRISVTTKKSDIPKEFQELIFDIKE